jgi:hypothetical protein
LRSGGFRACDLAHSIERLEIIGTNDRTIPNPKYLI